MNNRKERTSIRDISLFPLTNSIKLMFTLFIYTIVENILKKSLT